MITFDFVSGDEFRASLESDYQELNACMEVKAWKAVHVLAGSIIETILIDYLVASESNSREQERILRMSLADAITACKSGKILTQKTADLSSVVREYRNLIHPGRSARLNERADENGASIAQKLVEIIVTEVSKRRNEAFGYTAEQIIRKIENDASVLAILAHILKNINENEIRRLLVNVLPKRYFELKGQTAEDEEDDYWITQAASSIEKSFRIVLEFASVEVKKEVAKRFVSILTEENEYMVTTYEVVFFRAGDLEYLNPDEVSLVKQHILSRLSKQFPDVGLLNAITGIGTYLDERDVHDFVSAIVKTVVYSKDKTEKRLARERLLSEYSSMHDIQQEHVKSSLDIWKRFLLNRDQEAQAMIVEELRSEVEGEDIPF